MRKKTGYRDSPTFLQVLSAMLSSVLYITVQGTESITYSAGSNKTKRLLGIREYLVLVNPVKRDSSLASTYSKILKMPF